jgi:hypothetical protein
MAKLTGEQIEYINAHGPYNHSSWTKQDITITADWRCVYRSFYLLNQIYVKIGDEDKANKYRDLCNKANPMLNIL